MILPYYEIIVDLAKSVGLALLARFRLKPYKTMIRATYTWAEEHDVRR